MDCGTLLPSFALPFSYLKMKKHPSLPFRATLFTLLLSLLFACALPPYQQMSEAKQALLTAKDYVNNNAATIQDQRDYQAASEALTAAEQAVDQERYQDAKQLLFNSKNKSQEIIKRHLPTTNIHFESDDDSNANKNN